MVIQDGNLWITDNNLKAALDIPFISNRINNVRDFRLKSNKKATVECAKTPHKFGEIRYFERPLIIVPRVTFKRISNMWIFGI